MGYNSIPVKAEENPSSPGRKQSAPVCRYIEMRVMVIHAGWGGNDKITRARGPSGDTAHGPAALRRRRYTRARHAPAQHNIFYS